MLGCYQPPASQIAHEVGVTQELLNFWMFAVSRGKFVDPDLRPDATIWMHDHPVHLEFDRDSEGYKQVKSRLQHYIPRREPVIWVAPNEARMDGIRKRAKAIATHSFFKVAGSNCLYAYDGTEYAIATSVDSANVTDTTFVAQ